jgi:hypothetical protein
MPLILTLSKKHSGGERADCILPNEYRIAEGQSMTNGTSVRGHGISRRSAILSAATAAAFVARGHHASAQTTAAVDPLASWHDGLAKRAILNFVRTTTDPSSANFVMIKNRIATFDQDGTLWVEQPLYTQAMFALDRVRALAPEHPEWNSVEPFKTVLSSDLPALGSLTEKDWTEIVGVTHAGMDEEAFLDIAGNWIQTAKHPRFRRACTDLVYQPMLEVMNYLRANDFKTYIVIGGGQEFIRAYAERVYGVSTEQVVGSSIVTQHQIKGDKPLLMRLPKPFFINDGGGKAVGINMFIGKRPCAAFGNSTGDCEMLEWTAAGDGARLAMLVHHDDPAREFAHGPVGNLPNTRIGRFPDALMIEARSRGWTVISMQNDWTRMFAFDQG